MNFFPIDQFLETDDFFRNFLLPAQLYSLKDHV